MDRRLKITFVWYGMTGRYGKWKDGLWAAMKIIEQNHDVTYIEPQQDIPEDTDVILYWEAPCTLNGPLAWTYRRIQDSPKKKILLFAGGPIKAQQVDKFDLILVESKINEDELTAIGKPWMRAFGINSDVLIPKLMEKKYDAYMPATCAGWKRQELFSRAVKEKGVLSGRDQKEDPWGFIEARKNGTLVLDEQPQEEVCNLFNQSYTCLQTSEYWGGGQRATLEAMACGIPVIVMEDSPKNREYVEESGFGLVVRPEENAIREAIKTIKENPERFKPEIGRSYIESKWTPQHYADNILKGIKQIL